MRTLLVIIALLIASPAFPWVSVEMELDRTSISQSVQDGLIARGFSWQRSPSVSFDRMTLDVLAPTDADALALYQYLNDEGLNPFCLGAWDEKGNRLVKVPGSCSDESGDTEETCMGVWTPPQYWCPFNLSKWLGHQEDVVRIRYYSDPPENTNLVTEWKRLSQNDAFEQLVFNTPTIVNGKEYTRLRPTVNNLRERHRWMGWKPRVME